MSVCLIEHNSRKRAMTLNSSYEMMFHFGIKLVHTGNRWLEMLSRYNLTFLWGYAVNH